MIRKLLNNELKVYIYSSEVSKVTKSNRTGWRSEALVDVSLNIIKFLVINDHTQGVNKGQRSGLLVFCAVQTFFSSIHY